MSQLQAPTSRGSASRRFDNAADWLHALGDVPLERIVMDPWPGSATEDDLCLFVERDKRLCELVDGTLVKKPVGFSEGRLAITIAWVLLNWVRPRGLGDVFGADTMMRMQNERIRLPDVSFISTDRLRALGDPPPKIPTIAPDLAVEVLSDGNTAEEMDQKLKEYFESGTRLAWLVDPKRRVVAVYEPAEFSRTGIPTKILTESDSLDAGGVLPGFTVSVAELFTTSTRS